VKLTNCAKQKKPEGKNSTPGAGGSARKTQERERDGKKEKTRKDLKKKKEPRLTFARKKLTLNCGDVKRT